MDFPPDLMDIGHVALGYVQALRDFLKVPVTITSGYRSPSYNASIGSGKNSYHVWRKEKGSIIWAVDILSPQMPLDELFIKTSLFVNGEVYQHKRLKFVHLAPVGTDEQWIQS